MSDPVRILVGDCVEQLRTLPAGCVQTCVTSPPYYGLRSYLPEGHPDKHLERGLEPTPAEYVARMVDVFREVRRVLRDDATVWCNLGDSYGSGKQLLGIPWRVAFALQSDGWVLRQDVIFSKPNPMPESVRDRCTKAHEYVFLLAKSERYFYDADAVKEPASNDSGWAKQRAKGEDTWKYKRGAGGNTTNGVGGTFGDGGTRNKRSVWTVAPKPFKGAHFAVMPPELVRPCVRAGSSERGACPHCGAPWVRQVERPSAPPEVFTKRSAPQDELIHSGSRVGGVMRGKGAKLQKWRDENPSRTVGFAPSCSCPAHEPVPCVVLDPFGGSGTTALVALEEGRRAVLCELNPEYAAMARKRVADKCGLFAETTEACA